METKSFEVSDEYLDDSIQVARWWFIPSMPLMLAVKRSLIMKIVVKPTLLLPETLWIAETNPEALFHAINKGIEYENKILNVSSERIEPLCLDSFNDARECMFQSDGNVYNCRPYIKLFGNCQRNPAEFKEFLEASTDQQKKPRRFDFVRYRGHYDKFL